MSECIGCAVPCGQDCPRLGDCCEERDEYEPDNTPECEFKVEGETVFKGTSRQLHLLLDFYEVQKAAMGVRR